MILPVGVCAEAGSRSIGFEQAEADWELVRKLLIGPPQLDRGEAEVIALAHRNSDAIAVLDESRARGVAERLGISYTGTLGLLVRAKKRGIVPSIQPWLETLQQTDFRLSPRVLAAALKAADEA
ncbi:MAG: DUF3368 domain-containing protein [Planctomycetes bacterium]|nr:DUF3368 domain-containing protein [Planctomycetota bacterium]